MQHVYTATQSNLAAYTIPRWASNGGREEMLEPLRDSETVRRLNVETLEMLAFTRKLRQFVLDKGIIALPFAIRSMTGLAADFCAWTTAVTCGSGPSPTAPCSTATASAIAPPTSGRDSRPRGPSTAVSPYRTETPPARWRAGPFAGRSARYAADLCPAGRLLARCAAFVMRAAEWLYRACPCCTLRFGG